MTAVLSGDVQILDESDLGGTLYREDGSDKWFIRPRGVLRYNRISTSELLTTMMALAASLGCLEEIERLVGEMQVSQRVLGHAVVVSFVDAEKRYEIAVTPRLAMLHSADAHVLPLAALAATLLQLGVRYRKARMPDGWRVN